MNNLSVYHVVILLVVISTSCVNGLICTRAALGINLGNETCEADILNCCTSCPPPTPSLSFSLYFTLLIFCFKSLSLSLSYDTDASSVFGIYAQGCDQHPAGCYDKDGVTGTTACSDHQDEPTCVADSDCQWELEQNNLYCRDGLYVPPSGSSCCEVPISGQLIACDTSNFAGVEISASWFQVNCVNPPRCTSSATTASISLVSTLVAVFAAFRVLL